MSFDDILREESKDELLTAQTGPTPVLYEDPALSGDEAAFQTALERRREEEEETLLAQARKDSTRQLLEQRARSRLEEPDSAGDASALSHHPKDGGRGDPESDSHHKEKAASNIVANSGS